MFCVTDPGVLMVEQTPALARMVTEPFKPARPPPLVLVIENGRPDWMVQTPPRRQLPMVCPRKPVFGPGRSHKPVKTKRCVRSKSETPRLSAGTSWLPVKLSRSDPVGPESSSVDLEKV